MPLRLRSLIAISWRPAGFCEAESEVSSGELLQAPKASAIIEAVSAKPVWRDKMSWRSLVKHNVVENGAALYYSLGHKARPRCY